MRLIRKLLVWIALLPTVAACGDNDPFGDSRRYPTASGMVEYRLSGNRVGTETLYWDDWGARETRIVTATVSVKGKTRTENYGHILVPDAMYMINYENNSAIKTASGSRYFVKMRENAFQGMTQDQITDFRKKIKRSTGERVVGTEVWAGVRCKLTRMKKPKVDVCLYREKLLLRSHSESEHVVLDSVAVKVELDKSVDPARFAPPFGMKVWDLTTNKLPH